MVSESTKAAITKHRNRVASEEFHFLILLEAPKFKITGSVCVFTWSFPCVHMPPCVFVRPHFLL